MPRPLRLYYPGAKYHIVSRGNGRQQVFFDPEDYERFLEQLGAALDLNPVRVRRLQGASDEERVRVLRAYRWSSYGGYVQKRLAEERVSYRWLELMGRVRNRAAYRGYVEGAVGKEDKGFQEALKASRYAIGDEKYREQTAEDLRGLEMSKYVRDVVWPEVEGVEPVAVEKAVAAAFDVSVDDLHRHGRRVGIAKAVAVSLVCELSMKSQRAIARHFGYGDESSVGKQRDRLRTAIGKDARLRARVQRLKRTLEKP